MNVLSIGNSFSQDAQRYIHAIAKADGVTLNCFNLYIGGCTLERHFRNMMSDDRAYALEMNGESTGFYVTVKEALLNREWDYVTIQQASHKSVNYDSYTPYDVKLAEYVRTYSPKSKLIVHKTWAYEDGSARLTDIMGFACHGDMYKALSAAYDVCAKTVGADFIIPSGTLLNTLNDLYVKHIHRDSFHASFGIGRYALGLLWYAMLTGRDVTDNSFCDFDEPIDDETVALIKKCVMEIA